LTSYDENEQDNRVNITENQVEMDSNDARANAFLEILGD
jgi:hypothetical protein